MQTKAERIISKLQKNGSKVFSYTIAKMGGSVLVLFSREGSQVVISTEHLKTHKVERFTLALLPAAQWLVKFEASCQYDYAENAPVYGSGQKLPSYEELRAQGYTLEQACEVLEIDLLQWTSK
jgi:hypothetical protein